MDFSVFVVMRAFLVRNLTAEKFLASKNLVDKR